MSRRDAHIAAGLRIRSNCIMRKAMLVTVICLAFGKLAAAQDVQTPQNAISGQYIVVFDDATVTRPEVAQLAQALARQHSGRLLHVYEDALHGFAVALPATAAAALARNPRVRFVEQDSLVSIVATQPNATWGLDRIDQRDQPLDGNYNYDTNAANVDVYVIDTGIRSTHVEFGGRV